MNRGSAVVLAALALAGVAFLPGERLSAQPQRVLRIAIDQAMGHERMT